MARYGRSLPPRPVILRTGSGLYTPGVSTTDTWAWSETAAPSVSTPNRVEVFPSFDGMVRHTGTVWATVRGAATGTTAYPSGTTFDVQADNKSDATNIYIDRGFFTFDTSAIPDGYQIVSATLYLWVTAKTTDTATYVALVSNSQASPTTLATSDYSLTGTTDLATRRLASGLTNNAYNAFTLNAAGRAAISTTGYTKLAMRLSEDVDNSPPASSNYVAVTISSSEATGVTQDPLLVVEYAANVDRWDWSDSAAPYRRAVAEVTVWDQGANTTLNGAQTLGSTVTVADTTGFASSGTIFASDNSNPTYYQQAVGTYTGKTSTTFTGCSWTSLIGKTSYNDGSLAFGDGKAITAPDAETHFPQITPLDTTSTPVLLSTATQQGGHGILRGKIAAKKSVDGGMNWTTATDVISSPVNGNTYGVYGHTVCRMKNGRLIALWYEHKYDYTAADSIASFKTYLSYSDDQAVTWSTPARVNLNFGYSNDDGTNAYAAICYTGAGSNSTYGDLYFPAVGNTDGIQVHGSGSAYRWINKLYKITDGGASGTATLVSTIATTAQTGGYANGEADVKILSDGRWMAALRVEHPDTAHRWYAVSSDQGATWTGHTEIVPLENAGVLTELPGGTLITTGGKVGSPNNSSTTSYLSYDSGTTWVTSAPKYEAYDATYVGYNGSDLAVVINDPGTVVNTVLIYAQERSSQAGARTMFRWYVDPVARAVDAWAWSETASRTLAITRTTSDSWALSSTATKSFEVSQTSSDSWAWSETGTRTKGFNKTSSDAWAWFDQANRSGGTQTSSSADSWAWSETAAYTSPANVRTTTDTWSWTDTTLPTSGALYFLRKRRATHGDDMAPPTKSYFNIAQSAARTTAYTGPTQDSKTEAGIYVVLDVTAASGTGGLTLRINAVDQYSGRSVALNTAPTAVTATGTYTYALYPFGAISGAVTQSTSSYLPSKFNITVAVGDSSSYTYSIGYCLLP